MHGNSSAHPLEDLFIKHFRINIFSLSKCHVRENPQFGAKTSIVHHSELVLGEDMLKKNSLTLEKGRAELVSREDMLKKNNLTLEKGQAELVSGEDILKKNNLTLEKGRAELVSGEDTLKNNNLTLEREQAVLRNNKALLPHRSAFGDPGPHGDLFKILGPHFFFQGPHFLYFRLKNV